MVGELTQERLKELLEYDPETGIFRWLVKPCRSVRAGDVAGCVRKNGYIYISIRRKLYPAHRLAWLYVKGVWPVDCIDHIDLNPANNCISNLREATHQENAWNAAARSNNTSGYKGVCFDTKRGRWRSQATVNYINCHLGYFDTPEEAHAAYCKFIEEHHGDFARAA